MFYNDGNENSISRKDENELLEILKAKPFFTICYHAEKHKGLIIRKGLWTEGCVVNKNFITYWDTEKGGFRRASTKVCPPLIIVNENNERVLQ